MSSASSPASSMQGIEKARVAIADQRELRDQVLGRRRAVRLVLVVHLVAERMLRLVEDDRHVGRPVGLVQPVGQLPQHGRIAIDRADGSAVAVGQRRQPVIGAENVARPVDEIEVVLRPSARSRALRRFRLRT